MSKTVAILAAGMLGAPLAACGAQEPTRVTQPEPTYVTPVERQPAYKPEDWESRPEPEPESDLEMQDRVRSALQRVPGLQADNVRVTIEPGGVVHLTGHVQSSALKRSAHDVVHSIEGVTNVYVDDLNVR